MKNSSPKIPKSSHVAPPVPDSMSELTARLNVNVEPKGQNRPLPTPPSVEDKGSSGGNQRFNFALASSRDNVVFGAERPGMVRPDPDLEMTPRGPSISPAVVNEWCSHMRSKGIKRVVFTLTHSELAFYERPLVMQYQAHFSKCMPLSTTQHDVLQKVMSAIFDAVAADEPIVVHCSTGQTRTANILAAYLHQRYHIPIPEAIDEVSQFGQLCGAIRRPTITGVVDLLMGVSMSGSGALQSSRSSISVTPRSSRGVLAAASARQTPRSDTKFHVTFLQMGGNIDRDYLKSCHGNVLEVGMPAAGRVLAMLNHKRTGGLGFSYEVVTVCRKDSQLIKDEDKETLAQAIIEDRSNYFIVTHGVDSMLPTANYISTHACSKNDKVIIFTGAYFPQRFSESDAAFNIGTAIGALNTVAPGTYICMNGLVIDCHLAVRDVKTGSFRVRVPSALSEDKHAH